jgi:hypothetical protein
MTPIGSTSRLARLAIVAANACAVVLSGCVVAPMKVTSHTNGPTGKTIAETDIDLAFLQAGVTRREEVFTRMSVIDTGVSNSQMFWGRWSGSKWAVGGASLYGAGGNRVRHVHNLLLGFDENGVMQTKELIDDGKVLDRELRSQLTKAPPLDFSQPMRIRLTPSLDANGNPWPGSLADMTITEDEMQLSRENAKSPLVQISTRSVARISYTHDTTKDGAGGICYVLHMTERRPRDRAIIVCFSPAHLATMFKYLQQAGSPNIRWE